MGKLDYRKFCPQGATLEERRKIAVGDIYHNGATCLKCGDEIVSTNRHDFVTCKCGNLSVDGGSWYARRVYKEEGSYKDNIIYYKGVK